RVSVLIPARNEAENIAQCLHSVLTQNYPADRFEVIVCDDFSTDATAERVLQCAARHPGISVKLLRLADFVSEKDTRSFKKKALDIALRHARGDLIVTTDADCLAPPDWLALLVSFYEKNRPRFIAAPVRFYGEKNALERFQSLDFLGMMGTTGAGIRLRLGNMCNGANLAYEKTAFDAVGGFSGIDHLASGDDILLMQKIARQFPGQIRFLKSRDATILTRPKTTLRDFLSQRIRWASKSAHYPEWRMTLILGFVFLFCINMVFSLALTGVWGAPALGLFALALTTKSITDYYFLRQMCRFFRREDLLKNYPVSQLFHIAYILTVGILANIQKKYEWKGRRVR
ncbi:MAG: glycosyltransferase, partial [Bacteroidetes bacterium]